MMSEPRKLNNSDVDFSHLPLQKQGSLSHIEQSIKIIPLPPQQAPVTIYPGPKAGNQNLSKADLEIADRLEKLRKRSVEELPTEEEVALRLATLKGFAADHYIKSASLPYQRPDLRTQTEHSESLLKQVMEEVELDAKVTKPEDELQARLSRLKGDSTRSHVSSEVSDVSRPTQAQSHLRDPDRDEVAELMLDAEREMSAAKASLKSLEKDEVLMKEVKKSSSRKRAPQKTQRSTSSDELNSDDDDERSRTQVEKPGGDAQKEKEEVERVVNLYTQKARKKKEKRKALKKKDGKESHVGDSDSELSEEDWNSSTSDSERISDSD